LGCPRGPKAGKGLDGCARARPVRRRPGLRGEDRSFIGASCVVVAALLQHKDGGQVLRLVDRQHWRGFLAAAISSASLRG